MDIYKLVFLITCSLMSTDMYAADSCVTSNQNCSLFELNSDLISVQNLTDKDVTSDEWFMVYGSDFTAIQTYGRCIYKWTPSEQSSVIERQLMCYNFKLKKCENFYSEVTWSDDECGRAKELNGNNTMMGKFYSQDPRQYLFYYTCYYSTDPDICDVDYLDIILRKKQHKDSATNELDLGQVPWHMIAADLKNIYNMEFTNDKVMFQAKGPVCDFNGNIVTNAAGRWRLGHFVLLIVLLPIYIYNIPMYY